LMMQLIDVVRVLEMHMIQEPPQIKKDKEEIKKHSETGFTEEETDSNYLLFS